LGDERFERYLQSFEETPPVSIRLNPMKVDRRDGSANPVPWCRNAYYLDQRPNFTMDPLLHAGCYYVQEAASMFLDEVLRQLHEAYVSHQPSAIRPLTALDLCAAPGGKSTLLRSVLPADCVLYSNEPIRNRASILAENVLKWGYPNHIVTNNYPDAYRASKLRFDVILCDVPCSGEGMFRKDPATIQEWSPQNVEKCWQLQREIVDTAWSMLNEGGILIYSTCTFNTKENEENIHYFLEQYDDAKVVSVETKPAWNITGSLLEGFTEPVYRFIPGITRSEGLFLCVLRKQNQGDCPCCEKRSGLQRDCPRDSKRALNIIAQTPDEPISYPQAALSYPQAMAYLRHEALLLPDDTPRGLVEVCFEGHPLGLVKNIGSRANNLYPKEWKIKTTHIANEYEPIIQRL
jgi:16S rRNA C967 or C1407 C5-methylase (RsmB/RsmF family)